MTKKANLEADKNLVKKTELFNKNLASDMYFKSDVSSNSMSFDWVDIVEFTCLYIDNLVRVPKVTLIKEEDVVKIERARKIAVASVKDLSRHTQYIDKLDPKTKEVQPSKIMIENYEETFNTYENRFIYTLIDNVSRFVSKKELEMEAIETKNDKVLEYAGNTNNGSEKINIELKITSSELPNMDSGSKFQKELDAVKGRVKRIKNYMSSWRKSEMILQLEKAHAPFVTPPIKKTNLILKNPNFQFAMKLWDFLQNYNQGDNGDSKEGMESDGDQVLKGMLDDAFLIDYFVFDSINNSKREEKEQLTKYAIIMIKKEIQMVSSLLLNNGIKLSDEEIMAMVSAELKEEKGKRGIDNKDIKKKFKSAMDEYLEKTQNYL